MRHLLPLALLLASPAFAENPGRGVAPTVPVTSVFMLTTAATLSNPWAMTFLPDGRALVTQKSGELRVVATNGAVSAPIVGVPAVAYNGQNGLLDVVAHPRFASNRYVYLSFSEGGANGTSGLAIGYGRFVNNALVGFRVIWRDPNKVGAGNGHTAGRIAFAPDGTLFLSAGDRQLAAPAQSLTSAQGKILHMNAFGWVLPTRPFPGSVTTQRIWTLGHRNPLGIAFDAAGQLWAHEHGPQGGDELNRIEKGTNYGWPTVSNGRNYGSATDDIPDHDTRPDLNAPEVWWDPSIAPSGLIIYSGTLFPAFTGNAFLGALAGRALIRITMDGTAATETVRYTMDMRVREVEQGPDGAIWVLEDGGSGRLIKLTPKA